MSLSVDEQAFMELVKATNKTRDEWELEGNGIVMDSLISRGLLKETNSWRQVDDPASPVRIISNFSRIAPTETFFRNYNG